jgi:predicted RNase H-like HicB family nuclease
MGDMGEFYPIVIVRLSAADGGGYMGYAPDLPGCVSHGDSPEEAMASTRQAALEWLEEAKELKRLIPVPGGSNMPGPSAPKGVRVGLPFWASPFQVHCVAMAD